MRRFIIYLLVLVIAVIVTYFATISLPPRQATAPTSGLPVGANVIQMNIVGIYENATTSPTVSIEYPQFPALPAEFNDAIASATMSRLDEFKSSVAENTKARAATAAQYPGSVIPMNAYSFSATWQAAQVNARHVSFLMRYDSYNGGANENQELQAFDYDVAANRPVTLNDLFGTNPDYLQAISALARTQLSQSISTAGNGNVSTDMLNAGTEPVAENFKDFIFTDYAATFYFPKYAVAPGSFGEQHVVIPRSAVR